MSNPNGTNVLSGDITLAELARLVRILGMLGSAHDGEALNAARLAARWLHDAGTDWQTLLTPAPEQAVVGVAAPYDPLAAREAVEIARAQAFKTGYDAGLRDANAKWTAQLKAQARMAAGVPLGTPQQPVHGAQPPAGVGQAAATGGPVAPPAPPPGGYPAGSWQAVAQALLDRHASGLIPGVFRGSRETAFVSDVLARGFPNLTQPQETWLRDIAKRAGMNW